MRHWAVAVIFVSACGGPRAKPESAPAPAPVAAAFKCDDYQFVVGEAAHTPTSPGDNVSIQVYNACGCPSSVNTTGGMALRVDQILGKWRAAGCAINCDEPCARLAPGP
jgi:hypothetical protein